MEPILIISNLVLIGLTGTYAWLTNKSAKQLKQDNLYYRHVLEKQLQFSALPHLYWDLRPVQTIPSRSLSPLHNGESQPAHRQHSEPFHQQFEQPNSDRVIANQSRGQSEIGQGAGQNASHNANQSVHQSEKAQSTTLALEVFNISNVPAYDIHVSVIGAYTEESLGIATFMRTHVQPRHRKYPLQSDKVGYYGVRNALRLSLLPTQQKIVLSLPFPIQPVDVYTLVQYRELSGQNYYQVCCFSAIDDSGAYRANILEPSTVQFMERLHLFDIEDFTLPGITGSDTTGQDDPGIGLSDSKEDMPYYLADFIDLWNHSISSRLMLKAPNTIEEDVSAKASYDF